MRLFLCLLRSGPAPTTDPVDRRRVIWIGWRSRSTSPSFLTLQAYARVVIRLVTGADGSDCYGAPSRRVAAGCRDNPASADDDAAGRTEYYGTTALTIPDEYSGSQYQTCRRGVRFKAATGTAASSTRSPLRWENASPGGRTRLRRTYFRLTDLPGNFLDFGVSVVT